MDRRGHCNSLQPPAKQTKLVSLNHPNPYPKLTSNRFYFKLHILIGDGQALLTSFTVSFFFFMKAGAHAFTNFSYGLARFVFATRSAGAKGPNSVDCFIMTVAVKPSCLLNIHFELTQINVYDDGGSELVRARLLPCG